MTVEILNPQTFVYEGKDVTFNLGNGDVMVNATQMAKVFNKRVNDWTTLPSTKTFLGELEDVRKSEPTRFSGRSNTREFGNSDYQLVITKSGSPDNGGGTWMHEDVALEFARWLSPRFAIWCNDQIKMLLKHGVVATDNKIEEFLANPDLAIQAFTALKQEREKSRILESQVYEKESHIEVLECEIKQAVPKVQYHDQVMSSDGLLTTTQIAKNYGWSAIKLNNILKSLGVQFKQSGNWVLYQKYADKGFAKLVPYPYPKADGTTGTSYELKWFEIGKKFIHNLLKSEGYIS